MGERFYGYVEFAPDTAEEVGYYGECLPVRRGHRVALVFAGGKCHDQEGLLRRPDVQRFALHSDYRCAAEVAATEDPEYAGFWLPAAREDSEQHARIAVAAHVAEKARRGKVLAPREASIASMLMASKTEVAELDALIGEGRKQIAAWQALRAIAAQNTEDGLRCIDEIRCAAAAS